MAKTKTAQHHKTKQLNWNHTRRPEEVKDVYWISYVHPVDVLCPGVKKYLLKASYIL